MLKHSRQLQRLMFLFAVAGLFAVTRRLRLSGRGLCRCRSQAPIARWATSIKERIRTLERGAGPDRGHAHHRAAADPGPRWPAVRRGEARPPGEAPERRGRDAGPLAGRDPRGSSLAQAAHPGRRRLLLVRRGADLPGQAVRPVEPRAPEGGRRLPAPRSTKDQGFIGWTAESRTECEKIKLDARGSRRRARRDVVRERCRDVTAPAVARAPA